MSKSLLPQPTLWGSVKRNIFVGILALIPLWITLILLGIVLTFVRDQTAPLIEQSLNSLAPDSSLVQYVISAPWLQTILAVLVLLAFFYVIGFLAARWLGRQAMELIDRIMERIPVAKSIYGAIKGVTDAMQSGSAASSRVVLINFPSPELKSIGLVTKTTTDTVTGEELSVVFVPTSPTPTSGYVQVVPSADLQFTDWTVEEAMSFLISGGTDLPRDISLTKIAAPKGTAPATTGTPTDTAKSS